MSQIKEKLSKMLKVLVITFIVVVMVTVITNAAVILTTNSKVKSLEEFDGHYDYIIVLGCGIIDNSIPTDLMVDRLNTAISLYESDAAPKILLSGDHRVDDYNEVAVMRNYMLDYGIPEEDIICDDLGLSTGETMQRAAELFDVHSAIVVTQKYHLNRALYLARNYGIECEGVIATGHTFIFQAYYSGREVLARVKDFFFCIVF